MAHEDGFACSFYLALKGVNMHELEETSPIIVSSRVSHICYFFSKKQSPHMDFFLGKIYHFSTRMQKCVYFYLRLKRFSSTAAAYMHGSRSWWELCAHCQGGRICAGARGPPPKSLDSDENFKPENILFYRELRFCDYAQERRICRENCNYALD